MIRPKNRRMTVRSLKFDETFMTNKKVKYN